MTGDANVLREFVAKHGKYLAAQYGGATVSHFGDGSEPNAVDFEGLSKIIADHLPHGPVVILTDPSYVAKHVRSGIPFDYGEKTAIARELIEQALPVPMRGTLLYANNFDHMVPGHGKVGVLQVTRK